MTESSARGIYAPLMARLWRQEHGLSGFPSGISPAKSASRQQSTSWLQLRDHMRDCSLLSSSSPKTPLTVRSSAQAIPHTEPLRPLSLRKHFRFPRDFLAYI